MTSSVGPKFIDFHQYEPPRIAYSSSKLCFCFAECFLESLFSTSVWNNILIFFHFSRKEANGVDLLVETRCQLACVFPFPSSMFYIHFLFPDFKRLKSRFRGLHFSVKNVLLCIHSSILMVEQELAYLTHAINCNYTNICVQYF